jgi:hypothetical protein
MIRPPSAGIWPTPNHATNSPPVRNWPVRAMPPTCPCTRRSCAQAKAWPCATGPMFPRYVFFRPGSAGQSIAPVRSTLGVSHVVRFGATPATVDDALVSRPARVRAAARAGQPGGPLGAEGRAPRRGLRRAAQGAGGPGQRHRRQAHHRAARRAGPPDAGQCARSPAPGAGGLRPTSRPLGPSWHPPDAAAPPVAPIRATFRPLPAPGVGQFLASV